MKCDIFIQYNTRGYKVHENRFTKMKNMRGILLCVSSLQKSPFDASAFSSEKIKHRFDEELKHSALYQLARIRN